MGVAWGAPHASSDDECIQRHRAAGPGEQGKRRKRTLEKKAALEGTMHPVQGLQNLHHPITVCSDDIIDQFFLE
ncbi:hypothetical protein CFC21_051941 [Triticum aestivum]|uniref:Uncharacterized protein n=3 Tax=Triticum TaxID=4564 RepID=A0A9R0S763_TRITD|nr:hypothetical protein CFC21_051941 [Triticum aestivum]VAH89989.1 unnamed protein product [Triticum turgidum subsp. durum]